MVDLTDKLVNGHQADVQREAFEQTEFNAISNENKAKEYENFKGRMTSALDKTDISSAPDPEDFDYESEYLDGNGLTTNDDGGINLRVKNFNPGALVVAGIDVPTGEQVFNKFANNDLVKEGTNQLKEYTIDSKNGAPFDHSEPLAKIAVGIMEEGGTFDDFVNEVPKYWGPDVLAAAWQAGDIANSVAITIQEDGNDFASGRVSAEIDQSIGPDKLEELYASVDSINEEINSAIIKDINEGNLKSNPAWIDSSTKVMRFLKPWNFAITGVPAEESTYINPSPDAYSKINEDALWLMSMIKYNTVEAIRYVWPIIKSGDPELNRALV